jgi:hypothetical protein
MLNEQSALGQIDGSKKNETTSKIARWATFAVGG